MGRYFDSDVSYHEDWNDSDDFLEHSGIVGMKWGQRRYQNQDGTWTEVGKQRRRRLTYGQKRKLKKRLKKARAVAAENRKKQQNKERILREGTAKEAYAIRDQLTDAEKQQLINRLNWDATLKNASTAERDRKIKKLVNAATTVATVSGAVYNTANNINNLKRLIDGNELNTNNQERKKSVSHSEGSDDYVQHYGVQGMHWGIRRYQNYDGTLIQTPEARYARYKKGKLKSYSKAPKIGMSAFISQRDNSYENYMQFYNADGDPVAYTESRRGQYIIPNIEKHNHISDEELASINPKYGETGTTSNCACCSSAIEMRKMGYNVHAGRMQDGVADGGIDWYFEGETRNEPNSVGEMAESWKKAGPNAHGILTVRCKDENNGQEWGHAMCWENDEKGNTTILDGQVNKRMDLATAVKDLNIQDHNLVSYDMTNAKPNLANMTEDHIYESEINTTRDKAREVIDPSIVSATSRSLQYQNLGSGERSRHMAEEKAQYDKRFGERYTRQTGRPW